MTKIDGGRAYELATRAVREMACGNGSLARRLRDAWIHHLMHLELPGVPWTDLAERYRDIADYCRLDPRTDLLTIEGLPIDDQKRIAGEICELCFFICERWPPRAE